MTVMMLRYQVADEGAGEVAAAAKAVFASLDADRPKGLHYAYGRLADGDFVALMELDEGVENPLFGIEAARALQATIAKWVVGDAPAPQPLDLLGSYGLFG
jgi:hypothetical protein